MLHRVRITMLHKMLREAPTLGSNIDPPLDDIQRCLRTIEFRVFRYINQLFFLVYGVDFSNHPIVRHATNITIIIIVIGRRIVGVEFYEDTDMNALSYEVNAK
jgi:hypothetical protein